MGLVKRIEVQAISESKAMLQFESEIAELEQLVGLMEERAKTTAEIGRYLFSRRSFALPPLFSVLLYASSRTH